MLTQEKPTFVVGVKGHHSFSDPITGNSRLVKIIVLVSNTIGWYWMLLLMFLGPKDAFNVTVNKEKWTLCCYRNEDSFNFCFFSPHNLKDSHFIHILKSFPKTAVMNIETGCNFSSFSYWPLRNPQMCKWCTILILCKNVFQTLSGATFMHMNESRFVTILLL